MVRNKGENAQDIGLVM